MSMTEAVKVEAVKKPRKPRKAKELTPLPVKGYTTQSAEVVALVNEGKELQERVLRYIEKVEGIRPGVPTLSIDVRCLRKGTTEIEDGFMWVFRSVFQPQRISLPEDSNVPEG